MAEYRGTKVAIKRVLPNNQASSNKVSRRSGSIPVGSQESPAIVESDAESEEEIDLEAGRASNNGIVRSTSGSGSAESILKNGSRSTGRRSGNNVPELSGEGRNSLSKSHVDVLEFLGSIGICKRSSW